MNGYRLLLRLAPRRLRDRHASEMEALFRQRLQDAGARGRAAVVMVWLRAAGDLVAAYPTEWRRQRRQRGRIGAAAERRSNMLGSDLRYAWRALSHQKFGSAIVIAMLALGIAANVAVFALVNGLFLKPLPFPEPERLVYINETAPRWNLETTGITYADLAVWHKAQQAFEAIATFNRRSFNVATETGADRVDGASVSADFAKVLGIEPVIGRMFTAEEDRPQGPNVALIGTALWHERFGGSSDVLGKTIRLNSRQFTIIGVLPPSADSRAASGCGRRNRAIRIRCPTIPSKAPGGSSRAARRHRARPICCGRTSRSLTRATRRKTCRRWCVACASSSPPITTRSFRRWAPPSRCCSLSRARTWRR